MKTILIAAARAAMPVPDRADLDALVKPADPGARESSFARAQVRDPNVMGIAPNAPWFWVVYPDDPGAWAPLEITEGAEADKGTWWLPIPTLFPVIPGLCGQRTIQKGEDKSRAYDNAHTDVRRNGGIILDPTTLRYIAEKDCRDPDTGREGIYHLDAWSSPLPQLRGRRLRFSFDHQRYRAWLLWLVRHGIVPAPDEQILEDRTRRKQARIVRLEAEQGLSPEAKEARLAAAHLEYERVVGAQVPRPVKRAE